MTQTHAWASPDTSRPARTVLITGGAGFLGSHLATRLAAAGDTVYCLDNLYTGRRQNLQHLLATGQVHLIEHDLVEPLPELPRFDEIYNLACPASPVHYQADPVGTLRVCSVGVLNVLERADRDRARVFHASTSEIYGDPKVHPQPESYWGHVNPIGPRACYDEGKRFAETLMTDFCHQRGLTLAMVRIFNTYGPRMSESDGRVVSNFIAQALQGQPITIYGSGSQTRSFCYVDDLIDGFVALMAVADAVEGPVNLGNPNEITINELARIVIEATGSHSEVVHRHLPIDDPQRRRPDITQARQLLHWAPRIDLSRGIQATIDWFERETRPPSCHAGSAATIARHRASRPRRTYP